MDVNENWIKQNSKQAQIEELTQKVNTLNN